MAGLKGDVTFRMLALGLFLLGASHVVAGAQTPPDSSLQAGVFHSEAARIEIQKPAAWHFAKLDSSLNNLGSVRLTDEAFLETVKRMNKRPIMAATKHEESYAGLNPSVQLIVRPAANLEGQSGVELLQLYVPRLSQAFTGFKVLKEPYAVTVAGRPGKVTHTSVYDTRISQAAPPTVSLLRVESARNVASSVVASQSRPRLVVGARQSTVGKRASWEVEHTSVAAGATRAWWRRHGTGEWLPLPISATREDFSYWGEFPGSAGNVFTASLAEAAASEGEIDLKLFLQNVSGGTTEVVYEPAFVVEGTAIPRRRAVR